MEDWVGVLKNAGKKLEVVAEGDVWRTQKVAPSELGREAHLFDTVVRLSHQSKGNKIISNFAVAAMNLAVFHQVGFFAFSAAALALQ